MSRRRGLKVYSSRKIIPTEQEKIEYNEKLAKEVEKFERDNKCGGIRDGGYVRLHDRSWR